MTAGMVAMVAALAVLALGVATVEPAAVPLLCLPLLLVVSRVGGAGIDLSVSDAALAAATLVTVVTPRPFSPALRNLLWLSALYQFATLFTVVAHPHAANTVEWFHAWMLVSGALLVGWTIGRSGSGRRAFWPMSCPPGAALRAPSCFTMCTATISSTSLILWRKRRGAQMFSA